MQKETITLTPNRRLSRYLHKQSCALVAKKNILTWHSEKILPLTAWLTNYWQKCSDTRVLLTQHQERLLWQQIIEEILGKGFNGIVDTIIKAHELMTNWQLDYTNWQDYETEDISIFKRLNRKFNQYCKKYNFVVTCQLPSLLLPHLQHHDLKITLAEFDEYNPQLKTLVDGLEKFGCKITHYNSGDCKGSLQKRLSFTKQEDEITTIARWAKQIISCNQKTNIGVIVANLTNLRPEIIRIFTEVLGDTKNVNISAGIIFSSLPIISRALKLLELHKPLNLSTISELLLSPYISGAESEKSNRALFDFQLNQLNQSQFRISDIEFLSEKLSINISSLANALQKTQDVYAHVKNKKMHNSAWAKIFAQILQAMGWPGENNLTEAESASLHRFTELLHEFATTDLIAGKITYVKALRILSDLAKHTIFQPEQETNTPINILGTLEAAGINFDHLWIMGLDQESWPPAPTPNPFIPIKIQKEFELPHSSAKRELHFCETLTKRFKHSAKEVIFSHVKQIEDRVVGPSALIADIPEASADDLNLDTFTPQAKEIYCSQKIATLIDNGSLALKPNESIRGGNRLIESQSLCPFRAFAEFRLAAKEFKQFEPGISKLKRGILIHAALENFWQEVKTHQNLCTLNQEALQNLIIKCVKRALYKEDLPQTLYLLEQKCLIRLLNRWLDIEKSRPPFEVTATEKTIQTKLGPIQIKLRIDRIDRLADGNLLLIDYKTGKKLPTIFDWFGKRPKNPQLPLYCVAVDETQGFAFAQINIESIKFKDVSLDELAFGMHAADADNFKDNINWHELITYWRENLIGLANDFVAGHVQPGPLSPKVCKQC
jgi:ATP-dependent helicase/nuclease subunit B